MSIRPGDTVVHRGKFWDVEVTEMRGQERWARLCIRSNGKNPMLMEARWVRFHECVTEEEKDEQSV